MKSIRIAIDGPASSGKSTVAKILAHNLGYTYLDTGAMYRSATYLALKNNLQIDDVQGILKALSDNPISFGRAKDGSQTVFVGQTEVTRAIRDNDVTANVSHIAAIPEIREELVEQQRRIAKDGAIIMDGRDIGTTVLPNAELKIFLVASARSRAERRLLDLKERGIESKQTVDEIEKDIAARDYKDSHRKISPLKKADDAIEIDTTNMSIDQVVEAILAQIKKTQKFF